MPELPEVESIRRGLLGLIDGKVQEVKTDQSERFRGAEGVLGLQLADIERRGKYLIFKFGELDMIVHLGMTGSLTFGTAERYRAFWKIGDQVLTLRDPRGFGKVVLTRPGEHSEIKGLSKLGPEPLDNFDMQPFVKAFSTGGRPVKVRLLEQQSMAGVGNYICDEALWRAKVDPRSRKLSEEVARRLGRELIAVMQEALEQGGMSMRNYVKADGSQGSVQHTLQCYGRVGEPCLRCGNTLTKIRVGGRGTTWCPACQT